MSSSIILYAETDIAKRVRDFSDTNESDFKVVAIAASYDDCIEKALDCSADIILFQMTHPVYKIQNFFYELETYDISPTLIIFNIVTDNECVYSMTSHQNTLYMERLKRFFTRSLGPEFRCHFNYIGEEQESNLIMESRIKKLEKTEYLNDILRGVTYREFLYYKKKVGLKLNHSGYYVYLWNLTDIEYSDHDLNKNIYYFVGEEFLKECQEIVDMYKGGEAFFISPLRVCIIINDFDSNSEAKKQQTLQEMINKLNNVTNCKTAFNYMSGYIKNIEDIRDAYESFDRLKIYNFFCRDARLLTQQYINSIRKEVNYHYIDDILREIREIINYDIFDPKLNELVKKLFLDIIKPSLSYNLYYYCYTALISTLMDKYNGQYNKKAMDNNSPTQLYYSSIEQKYHEFMESVHLLKALLSIKNTIKNTIVLKTIEFIHENYSEDITVNLIASELNVSNSYLSQVFKKELGVTIIHYIITYRIQKAKELISSSDELISNVASKVGYFDVKHFSKTFKKITGHTPMQYKKQNQKAGYV
ncbi:AraC family transcriptional regulator [Ferviditalea candida]|uniref:AraC family transcriptional regulator n=1 Tax=Ferviditalea candida TaxID=3108399 RepID=A0ABU5ZDJ0_9BACL|nr:AraC family transcriptional regulator [Paenibacillaceae bacterium T2]